MKERESQRSWWQPALSVFAEVTGWIVAPIIIALFVGKYLDERYNSEPWFFLSLTAIAFIISCVGIVMVAKKYIKQIEKENKEKLIEKNKLIKKDNKIIKDEELIEQRKDERRDRNNSE